SGPPPPPRGPAPRGNAPPIRSRSMPRSAPSPAASLPAPRRTAPLRPDPPLDHLTALRQDADLAFHLVYVDAKMLHGWPPPLRHTTACTTVGLRPPRAVAASRFIPSSASTSHCQEHGCAILRVQGRLRRSA